MFSELKDPLDYTAAQYWPDLDLCHFAQTSKIMRDSLLNAIFNKAIHHTEWLEAALFLNKKINFFFNESDPTVEKIQRIINHFPLALAKKENGFTLLYYFSNHNTILNVSKSLYKNFLFLNTSFVKSPFYHRLRAEQEKESVILKAKEIMEKQQGCPSEYICIDVNQSSLSLGNKVLFSLAKKKLDLKKGELSFSDTAISPRAYYNRMGYHKISLISDSEVQIKLPSNEVLNEISIEVKQLSEVRLLELWMFIDYTVRNRAYFLSVLSGANQLPKLRTVAFEMAKVSDTQLTDIIKWIKKRLANDSLPLEYIDIQCQDITSQQVINFVQLLKFYTKKPIIFHLEVSFYKCGEKNAISKYQKQFKSEWINFCFATIS